MRPGNLARITPAIIVCGLAFGCADAGVDETDLASEIDVLAVEEPSITTVDSTPQPDDTGPTPARWTADATEVNHAVTGAALLTDVATSTNEGFDRLVLEFEGEEMPSYHIGYIDRPAIQCGSGDPVEIEGAGWLAVGLEPANAHTEQGEATIGERSSRPALGVLREVTMTCDFEARVEWVLGVASRNRYRVMELADPTRLVVDVRH